MKESHFHSKMKKVNERIAFRQGQVCRREIIKFDLPYLIESSIIIFLIHKR